MTDRGAGFHAVALDAIETGDNAMAERKCDTCGTTERVTVAPHIGKLLCDGCFMAVLVSGEERAAQRRSVTVGDPVLYHPGDGGPTVLGIVKEVADHDGDVRIDDGTGMDALDVKMGLGPHTFETLDVTPDWTIVHCPDDGHRWPSFMAACPNCGTALHG